MKLPYYALLFIIFHTAIGTSNVELIYMKAPTELGSELMSIVKESLNNTFNFKENLRKLHEILNETYDGQWTVMPTAMSVLSMPWIHKMDAFALFGLEQNVFAVYRAESPASISPTTTEKPWLFETNSSKTYQLAMIETHLLRLLTIGQSNWTRIHVYINKRSRPRVSPAVVALGHKIYRIGGRADHIISDSIDYYDVQLSKWIAVNTTMNIQRTGRSAVAMNSAEILICGGAGYEEIKASDSCEVYDTTKNDENTSNFPKLTESKSYFKMLKHENFVYVFGGQLPDVSFSNVVERIDLLNSSSVWTQVTELPVNSREIYVVSMDNYIFLLMRLPGDEYVFYRYEPQINVFTLLQSLKDFPSCGLFNFGTKDLFIVAGEGKSLKYDVEKNALSETDFIPAASIFATLVSVEF